LRIALLASAMVHWSADNWRTAMDVRTHDTKLGVHVVDLPTEKMPVGQKVIFTFRWDLDQRWEGIHFTLVVE